jgi:ABC-2 type transport system permease protein
VTAFTGTARLIRLAMRRDRLLLPVWLLVFFVLSASITAGMVELYPTPQERADTAANRVALPMIVVLRGPLAGDSMGQLAVHESYMFQAVLAMVMAIALVARHTRQNEETGRSEMLLSAALGRYAIPAAALTWAVTACLGVALAFTAGMVLNGMAFTGSLAGGLGVASVGLVFAGIAAVTAQLTQHARTATGLALALGGIAFVLRSIGDANATPAADATSTSSAWVSWLSPLGWGQQMRAFEDERWWVLALPLAAFIGLVLAAAALLRRRDDGMGLFPASPGPARASITLLGPLGLAWRLQRGVLLAWAVAIASAAILLGAIGAQSQDLASQSAQVEQALVRFAGGDPQADPRAVFLTMVISMLAVALGAYGVQALGRLRHEETGPLESVLAAAVPRTRWMSAHVLCAAGGAVVLLVLLGGTLGLSAAVVAGELGLLMHAVVTSLQQIPAVLALLGFAALMFAAVPRWSPALAWSAVAAAAVLLGLATAVALTEGAWQLPPGLPEQVLGLSPFAHTTVPATPEVSPAALVALLGAAAALTAAGLARFRGRDLVPA